MADADLSSAAVAGRSIAITDSIIAFTPGVSDAAAAAKTDPVTEFIALLFANPPPSLTSAQQAALRTLLAVLDQAEVDARAAVRYTDSEQTKLGGIAAGATAVSIADVLSQILAGTGVTIDSSTQDQITLASSGITGVTAAAGLSGGGSTGAVSLAVDVTATDFPTVPVVKGGTGATDIAAARTALGAAALAGATFTGATGGIAPVGTSDFVTKAYADANYGGASPVAGDHTRRGAVSTDETLSQAEVTAGTTSMTQAITMPTWAGSRRFLYIGVPEADGDITGVSTGGIDVFAAWERVTGVLFAHKWWKTINDQSDAASGAVYQITEA